MADIDNLPQGDMTPSIESKNIYLAPEPPKKKRKAPLIIGIVAAVVVLLVGMILYAQFVEAANEAANAQKLENDYKIAVSLMAEGKYEEAVAAFEVLNGYKDSAERIEECNEAIRKGKEETEETGALTEPETEEVTTEEETTEEVTTPHVHTEEVLAEVAPTCTETGLTAGKQCRECGVILLEQETIPATGHTPDADATCTEPQNCTVCGEMMNSANRHIPGFPANCTTAQTCTVCHIELAPALGHTAVTDPAVAATCTKTGLTEGSQCSGCGKILKERVVVPATGHTPGKEATCTDPQKCTVCNTILTAASGHSFDDWYVAIYPTGTKNGEKRRICTKCDRGEAESIIPQAFTVTSDNRNQIGYAGTAGEALFIPAVFQNGNTWYRVTSIGDFAFEDCSGLTSIVIPDSVTGIGDYAFRDCSGLTSIEIPDGVTSIGEKAFSHCTGLTSIAIPDSVTSIGNSAFYNCFSLTSIEIPDGVTSIGNAAFMDTRLISIEIPDSVTSIGGMTFYRCFSLTSIVIPNSVTNIGNCAFTLCTGLTSIEIPDSVASIGNSAFSWCENLISVVIPDSVTSIGDSAFSGCSGLTDIYYTGTESEWAAITKGTDWDAYTGNYTIHYNYVP